MVLPADCGMELVRWSLDRLGYDAEISQGGKANRSGQPGLNRAFALAQYRWHAAYMKKLFFVVLAVATLAGVAVLVSRRSAAH
jgi:hypothetical protein